MSTDPPRTRGQQSGEAGLPEVLRHAAGTDEASAAARRALRRHAAGTDEASAAARRALRARMAAHQLHAGIADAAAHTAPARAAFLSRFEREVDPDGALDPRERARRAEHARKAYFLRLALASAHARSARGPGVGRRRPASDRGRARDEQG